MTGHGVVIDHTQPNAADGFVTYSIDNGAVQAAYNTTQCIVVSPEMSVQFPKLTKKDMDSDRERGIDRKYPELEITMKDAGHEQHLFKSFMDQLDEKLVKFMCEHQVALGLNAKKKGALSSQDEIRMMLRQSFRPRCSQRTGRIYPDAMSCKYRAPLDSEFVHVPVFDDHNQEYTKDIESGDTVRVALIYTGCYAKQRNFFGNSWSLISVRFIRKPSSAESAYDPSELFGTCAGPSLTRFGTGREVTEDAPRRSYSRAPSTLPSDWHEDAE